MYEPDKLFTKEKLPEFSPAVVELERTFSPDLKGLCDWLETQGPGDAYCINSAGTCLFGRFHQALGIAPVVTFAAWPGHERYGVGLNDLYPSASIIAADWPHTYGGALSRARAALESQP